MELDFASAFGEEDSHVSHADSRVHGSGRGTAIQSAAAGPASSDSSRSSGQNKRLSAAATATNTAAGASARSSGKSHTLTTSPPLASQPGSLFRQMSPKLRGGAGGGGIGSTGPQPLPQAAGSTMAAATSVAAAAEIASDRRDFASATSTPLLQPSAANSGSGSGATAADMPSLDLGGGGEGGALDTNAIKSSAAPAAGVASGIGAIILASTLSSADIGAATASPPLPLPDAPLLPKPSPDDFRLLAVIGRGAYGKVLQVSCNYY